MNEGTENQASSEGPADHARKKNVRLTRETAERLLTQTVARAQAYNRESNHLLWVERLAVFGSYLDPERERLGDLDVAIQHSRRDSNDEYMRRVQEGLKSRPRRSFLEDYSWPELELYRLVKSGSKAISLHPWYDMEAIRARHRVLFKRAAATRTPGRKLKET